MKTSIESVNLSLQEANKCFLNWYDEFGRVLPWRAKPGQTPNPYHVLLSEFMLQQTIVQTVIPYFHNFINRWPSISDLAAASENDILTLWQGLGYYARARNLLKAAQALAQLSSWPTEPGEIMKLPGIGPYTSRAIASIGFDKPFMPVDGNFIRVFSRLYGIKADKETLKRELQLFFDSFTQYVRPGDFAQSVMDFANIVCKPKNPSCEQCPFHNVCLSADPKLREERENSLRKKKEQIIRYAQASIIRDKEERLLLVRNNSERLLKGLLMPPLKYISKEEWESQKYAKVAQHTFSHFKLNVGVVEVGGKRNLSEEGNDTLWVTLDDIQKHPLSSLAKKVIKAAGIN